MNKKIILTFILALGLAFNPLIPNPAHAEENTTVVNEPVDGFGTTSDPIDDTAVPTNNSDDITTTSDDYEFIPGLITTTPREGECVLEGDIGIPCPVECFNEDGVFQDGCRYDSATGTYTTPETVLEEGTSGEPEVVCASTDEPGCEDAELEAETDPELWPLILSLSVLGFTILFVIIINLFGRKKK